MDVVEQFIINGRLLWYRTLYEDGQEVETSDGFGFPPEWIRNKLLLRDGHWDLLVDPESKIKAVYKLKKFLDLKHDDVALLLKTLPGVAFSGTKYEALWLQQMLHNEGIAAEINRQI